MRLTSDAHQRASYNRTLLRALLREASYLPDARCRSYFRDHIVSRFRAYNPRDGKFTRALEREEDLHHQARKSLHKLNRANNGYQADVTKALILAYGRTGKRSHVLIEPLRRPEPQKNLDDPVLQLKNRPNIPPDLVDGLPHLTIKLQALLKSQVSHSPPELVKPKLKRLSLNIPEKNHWQRRMPANRVAHDVNAWHKGLLSKVLPPLPEEEWQSLKDLATGHTKSEPVIPRRTYCATEEDRRNYHRRIGIHLDTRATLFGLGSKGDRTKPHHLTSRFMQRVYQEVFRQCPRMDWHEERQKWYVQWGAQFLGGKHVIHRRANRQLGRTLSELDSPSDVALK